MVSIIVFWILVLIAFGVFAWSVTRYLRSMLLGSPETQENRFDSFGSRIGDFIKYFLFQRKVADLPSKGYPHVKNSLHHLLIFWGFLIITVETTEMLISGLTGVAHPYSFIGKTLYTVFRIVVDLTNFVILGVMFYSFLRRVIIRPKNIPMSLDAGLILGMIAALTLSYHALEAFTIQQKVAQASAARGAQTVSTEKPQKEISIAELGRDTPVSMFFAGFLTPVPAETAKTVAKVSWWIHMLIILFFLNYLPYSKHIHLLGAWANILFRLRGPKGVMPKIDLEAEGEDEDAEPAWGVAHFRQFTWKELLDTYACTECARCTNHCPANLTDKPLSPMDLMHDIRYEMLEKGKLLSRMKAAGDEEKKKIEEELEKLPPLVAPGAHQDPSKGRIADETLWSCTTCGACREVCPVFIEHPNAILRMRTNLVLAQEGRIPQGLANAFQGLERNMNPWGLGSDSRFDWAEGLDVPVFGELDDPEKVEYCYFIGCAGNYDLRCQKQTKAVLTLLKAADVSFAVLGPEEVCCGDAARRAGHEYLFQMIAEQTIESLKEYKVNRIITGCPHGYHTFRKEYPQFGGNFEVWHLSQFIVKLMSEGRLKLGSTVGNRITLHDSCYLGRWNDLYDEPREIARAVAGSGGYVELDRARRHSFCCGAGGGYFWTEEEAPRINENRVDEILKTGADVVAVACPFCTTMITDGLKAADKDEAVQVLDISEIVVRAAGLADKREPEDAPEDKAEESKSEDADKA